MKSYSAKSEIIFVLIIISVAVLIILYTQHQTKAPITHQKDLSSPKSGFVPDAETAIKIAEAVWLPIYGKRIYKFTPFKAELNENEVWVVEGTLSGDLNGSLTLGGVPYAYIRKKDAQVLGVIHTK